MELEVFILVVTILLVIFLAIATYLFGLIGLIIAILIVGLSYNYAWNFANDKSCSMINITN